MRFANRCLIFVLLAAAAQAQFLADIRVTPGQVTAGSGDTVFTVSGGNFKAGYQLYWNGQPRPTSFVSAGTIKVTVSSADLALPGLGQIALYDANGSQLSYSRNILVYIPLITLDLAYDSVRTLLYASVSGNSPNGPSIAIIDPAKGIVTRYLPLPSEPGVMALSANAQYLYVALQDHLINYSVANDRIRRIDLTGATPSLDVSTPTYIASILPLPGDGTSFVTAAGLTFPTVYVFDGATARPNHANEGPSCLVGLNGSTLYGAPQFQEYTLSATGLTNNPTITVSNFLGGTTICPVYAGGLLYGMNGDVVDPTVPKRVSHIGAYGMLDVAPDRGQIYYLGSGGTPTVATANANVSLMIFDSASYALLSSTPLPIQLVSFVGRMVHWGADGIAFIDNGLYLLHTASLH